jgi:hypothetical protein
VRWRWRRGGGGGDALAIQLSGLGANGFNYTQGSYLLGFVVKPRSNLSVTQLAWYDAAQTGRSQTFEPHAVAIYDLAAHTLLGQATVDGSSPVDGPFRWKTLGAPIALEKDGLYGVVGITGTNAYTVGILATEATVASDLALVSGAVYSSTGTADAPTQTSTLVEPNAFDAGNIFGSPTPSNVLPDFGPNFRYTVR